MTRKLAITLSGIVSIVFTVAVTVLSILLASYLTPQAQKVSTFSFAAAIVQCISLCMTTALLFLHVQRRGRNGSIVSQPRRQTCLAFTSITITFLAATAIGFTLGWAYNKIDTFHGLVLGLDTRNFMLLVIVVYGLAILAQVLFLVCLLWVRDPARYAARYQLPAPTQTAPEMSTGTEEPSPDTTATVQSNPFREVSFSRPASASASEAPSSLRSSLSIVTRQNTSKTKLIRQSSFPRYSRSSSFDNSPTARPSQDSEGFDSWDTSTVASHIRETVHQSPLVKKKGLEPIPGSRSPSPANALEGPFFNTSPESSPPPSPLPQPSYSRPPSRQRAPSSEEHIHPLFRTCSPAPPPSTTSGTVVLAAPVAGALVNERILRRMRSGSLPSSPSPLVRSESYFDYHTAPTSPAGETPPIPNFILEAGERGSMEAYQGRRAASMKSPRLPGMDR